MDTDAIGTEAYELMRRLFPLCRSLTGNGVRTTFDVLEEHIPVERTEKLRPDIIVFNTSVPPEAKARCIHVLRAINAQSRVINVYNPVPGQGPDIPADAYLEKPFNADDLVSTIRRLLIERSEAT